MMHSKKADAYHLLDYVTDHGADHDDECPADDTCDCSFRERNAAVNRLVQALVKEPAPPAVAGGDAPEIQVGDWVALNTRYETDSTYILSGLNRVTSEIEADNFNQRGHWYRPLLCDQPKPDVSELRGERDGQPFIWRRRQEG